MRKDGFQEPSRHFIVPKIGVESCNSEKVNSLETLIYRIWDFPHSAISQVLYCLEVGFLCSFDIANPKLILTVDQAGLGCFDSKLTQGVELE
jgi:hypothetical protein